MREFTPCVSDRTMDVSDSFYEFDTPVDCAFTESKRTQDQVNLFEDHHNSLKFGDLGSFCNEESIDLEQYLHLGNTPPNSNGDELLQQFGAYSSSPPVTVTIKPHLGSAQTLTLSQELASVSLSSTSTTYRPVDKGVKPNIIQSVNSSSATNTQLGFQIKKEIEEYSVPDFQQQSEMPPGEEQGTHIVKGDQGNHLGGQQMYIFPAAECEDVVTTSTAAELYGNVYTIAKTDGKDSSNGGPSAKKRHRDSLISKESDEYKTKRIRNNIAVRKSREKSKAKNQDLQTKVQTLQSENEKLNKKVELLTKELTVLRSLFTTVKPSSNTSQ